MRKSFKLFRKSWCFLILLLIFGASILFITIEVSSQPNSQTHTVLGEFGCSTFSQYDTRAHRALRNIWFGQWHDSYFISFVHDKNTNAYNRVKNELGLTGVPTLFWDPGEVDEYRRDYGAGSVSAAQAAYNTSIVLCGNRAVFDVNVSVYGEWLGNATMNISVVVDNNNLGSGYTGHLHVYVTEGASSLYMDKDGSPYTFAFLDYAFNQDIYVPANSTWTNNTFWNGSDYDDGYGNDFSGIQQGNIMVIASVFQRGSSKYVDSVDGVKVGNNNPPRIPNSPYPQNNTEENPTSIRWISGDPDGMDLVKYDVYFGNVSSPPKVSSNQTSTSYFVKDILEAETTYYWRIVARDDSNTTSEGPTWSFTTTEKRIINLNKVNVIC